LKIGTLKNIGFDPTDHINTSKITVLIERDNPKKYYQEALY